MRVSLHAVTATGAMPVGFGIAGAAVPSYAAGPAGTAASWSDPPVDHVAGLSRPSPPGIFRTVRSGVSSLPEHPTSPADEDVGENCGAICAIKLYSSLYLMSSHRRQKA